MMLAANVVAATICATCAMVEWYDDRRPGWLFWFGGFAGLNAGAAIYTLVA